MIYTVECSFADDDNGNDGDDTKDTQTSSEAEWNDFYSFDKLPALISVTGFHTSQRFRALTPGCPVYLAIHTIDGPDILTGTEYHQKGGGNFARWQHHITDWHRNLYHGINLAPAVDANEYLVLCTGRDPDAVIKLGLTPIALTATELEKFPEHRWLAILDRAQSPAIADLAENVHLYAPMTPQLTPGATANARTSTSIGNINRQHP